MYRWLRDIHRPRGFLLFQFLLLCRDKDAFAQQFCAETTCIPGFPAGTTYHAVHPQPLSSPRLCLSEAVLPRGAWSCSCKLRGGASLSLLSTFGACRLLLTAWAPFTPIQSPWHPLGGLVLLPIKGIPLGLLRPAAVWSVSQGAIAAQILPLPGERRPRQRVHRTSPLRSGLITPFRIWFWCGLLPSLPRQVWAAPRPFGRTLIG